MTSPAVQQLLSHYINAAHIANGQKAFEAAHKWCELALSIDKSIPEAWYNLALSEKGLGRREAALAALERARELTEVSAEAQNAIGLQFMEMGAYAQAEEALQRAIQLSPTYAIARSNQGKLLWIQGRSEEAEMEFRAAIDLQPNVGAFHLNLCSILVESGHNLEAEAAGRKAVALDERSPHAWSNLGAALDMLGRHTEAIDCFDHALRLEPNFSDAWFNKGNALNSLGRHNDASHCYEEAIRLDPGHGEAHLNLGRLLFSQKRFAECWARLENRWNLREERPKRLVTDRPSWDGTASSRPLLLWGEQGIGDQILYASILPELARLPQKKYVALDKRLLPLFERSMPGFEFIDLAQVSDALDFAEQLPLGSLPRLFRPDLASFAGAHHPFLQADPKRTAALRAKIVRQGTEICGIAWSSNRRKLGPYKTIQLEQMIASLPSGKQHFVDLQYGDTRAEREALSQSQGIFVQHLDEVDNFNDLEGLAALIQACDVVITTSNSTAHLAGALGKETLLLLPFERWILWYWVDFEGRVLWYPSVRPFLQTSPGDWHLPLQEIAYTINGKT